MKFIVEDTDKINLHIHTLYSDGLYDVDEIIACAIKEGVECLSFTDHNVDEARFEMRLRNLKRYNLKVIPGVELSVACEKKRLYLLDYNYNHMFAKIVIPKLRRLRNEGTPISLEKARKLIHMFGGKAILAHPFKYNYDGKELVNEVLNKNCIDGIECIHSYHTQEEIDYLLEICEKKDLFVSAGSDFHYMGKSVRNKGKQDSLNELVGCNSTIKEQVVRAKEKYNSKKKR